MVFQVYLGDHPVTQSVQNFTINGAEQDTGICPNYQHSYGEVPGKNAIALLSQLAMAQFL